MVRGSEHILLVPFASGAGQDSTQKLLRNLGYNLDVMGCEDWLTDRRPNKASTTILFFGKGSWPKAQTREVLDRVRTPIFGVFEVNSEVWDQDIVKYCSEVVSWPCSEKEFAYRLARLASCVRSTTSALEIPELADEFIRLNLIGASPIFLNALRLIRKIAQCDASVLIEGETGTGKELAARAIHYLGARRDHPFIPVNCGSIPDALFENELFGHEKGAFTDAKSAQTGLVEQARGGTLFLDEIDALTPKAQVALLRFLQDQEYRPLGSGRGKVANLRFIAATNADLARLTEQGLFRSDLLYRLNIISIELPTLRQRNTDIRLLAEHFIREYRVRYQQPHKYLHPDALQWLETHSWPGNVRELENLVHREFLLAEGAEILGVMGAPAGAGRHRDSIDHCGTAQFAGTFNDAKARVIDKFEKGYLRWLMTEAGGNVTLAANRSGKERRALGKLLKKHGISPRQFIPRGE